MISNVELARQHMVEQQVRPWDVLDQRVLDVMAEVPRERFFAPEHHGVAFSDFELPIGHGQHALKPNVDGRLLQALALNETDRMLEVGTGSGWLSACLARLCAHVDSLEIVAELSASAGTRLAALSVSNVALRVQDASEDWSAEPAYDAILLSGSVPEVPVFYRDRLAIGGRLVVVVGTLSQPTMEARLLMRTSADEWFSESLFETRLTPLAGFTGAARPFVF